MEINKNQSSLFIICPFCQLENYLRTKFGTDIYFISATAGVVNFYSDELSLIKGFIRRAHIQNIYLVNDVSCNFIDEAIKNDNEFGLHAEQQLRELLQTIQLQISKGGSLQEMKKIVAETNVQQQANYLATENMLKNEVETLAIKIHTLIINKNELISLKFQPN